MTPKERAAIQQALEAIGDCSPNRALVHAAYALREALAEPVNTRSSSEYSEVKQEPVAWKCYRNDGTHYFIEHDPTEVEKFHGFTPSTPLYSAPVEPVKQEPVTEWEKLKDPQTLFVNLNRGFPAQLTPDHLLHLLNKTEQAEQEPVAWVDVTDFDSGDYKFDFMQKLNGWHYLYAAPVGAEHFLKAIAALREGIATCRAEALEEAAKVCEEGTALIQFQSTDCYSYAYNRAAAIRSLK